MCLFIKLLVIVFGYVCIFHIQNVQVQFKSHIIFEQMLQKSISNHGIEYTTADRRDLISEMSVQTLYHPDLFNFTGPLCIETCLSFIHYCFEDNLMLYMYRNICITYDLL